MTSKELIADLPLGPGDTRQAFLYARLLFSYLADHVYRAELANGSHVRDASDFSQWCRELAAEARNIGNPLNDTEALRLKDRITAKVTRPASQTRWDECNRCGHVHEGIGECGVRMGPNLICRCELELSS